MSIMKQKITKQEIQKAINMVKEVTESPVILFTSNMSYIKLLDEYFPGENICLVSEDYLPDSNTCYVVPMKPTISFKPLLLNFKEDL